MKRMDRVNERIQRELGLLFEKDICSETNCLVTVTEVATSPDLHRANVLVSVYGSKEQQDAVFRLLHRWRPEFQREIASRVRLKYTPVLSFRLDERGAKADRILRLLESLETPKDHEQSNQP